MVDSGDTSPMSWDEIFKKYRLLDMAVLVMLLVFDERKIHRVERRTE